MSTANSFNESHLIPAETTCVWAMLFCDAGTVGQLMLRKRRIATHNVGERMNTSERRR